MFVTITMEVPKKQAAFQVVRALRNLIDRIQEGERFWAKIAGDVTFNEKVIGKVEISELPPGHSKWTCPKCKDTVVVSHQEYLTIGVPMCSDCDCEME